MTDENKKQPIEVEADNDSVEDTKVIEQEDAEVIEQEDTDNSIEEHDDSVGQKSLVKVDEEDNKLAFQGIHGVTKEEFKDLEFTFTKLMRSKKGGIASVEDGISVYLRAKDLNLPFTNCIEHIHVINGKTGVDVHIIKALLSRAGVLFNKIKDFAPLYEYTDGFNVFNESNLPDNVVKCKSKQDADNKSPKDGDDDGNMYVYPTRYYRDFYNNTYKEYNLTDKHVKVSCKAEASRIEEKKGLIGVVQIPNQPIDYVTEYEFKRILSNGFIKVEKSRFTHLDAVKAELYEKDTYKKFPKVLISHRAFTYGAREIASDLIMGCMETTELKAVNNIPINDSDIIEVEADIIG